MKHYFKDINETASLDRLEGAEKLFRLRYTNQFYGDCSLRFHLRRLSDGQIHVNRSSMQVEASEVKKGDLNSLVAVSLRFLTQKLAQHPEIFDGERVAAQPGWLAHVRAWCGLSQPEQNPAIYEKNRSGLRKAGTP